MLKMLKSSSIKKSKYQHAFTLVEILLVVIIIGALSAMIFPRLTGKSDQAKVTIARSVIESNLATALKLYELDNGNFPSESQGLAALWKKPTTGSLPTNWNGPYIEKMQNDPWGNPYMYKSPGKNRSDYDLYSQGKDVNDPDDDITNWN